MHLRSVLLLLVLVLPLAVGACSPATRVSSAPLPSATPVSPGAPGASAAGAPPTRDAPATAVLAWWDARRLEAWRSGDVEALGHLYARRSAAGAEDVARLRGYLAADVRVVGWQVQRLAVRETQRSAGRVVADVLTRLRGVTVAEIDGAVSRTLPTSAARRVRISLRWAEGRAGWRVEEVRAVRTDRRPAPRAAPAPRRGARS